MEEAEALRRAHTGVRLVTRIVGSRSVHFIGLLAHWAIYTALLLALVPFHDQVSTWVLCISVAAIGAWFWPVLDYFITAAVATVSVLCAVCFVSAVLAAVWLTARLAEKVQE
jgi:hypothetical protein